MASSEESREFVQWRNDEYQRAALEANPAPGDRLIACKKCGRNLCVCRRTGRNPEVIEPDGHDYD